MEYEAIEKVNKEIKATKLKNEKTGKVIGDYVEVNQRIIAFRKLHPLGSIITEMLSNQNGICVFKASAYTQDGLLLATGTAYEKEDSTFINKTSYIENAETSSIGRCLGIAGFGIDSSIASKEEVVNIITNQEGIEMTLEEAENYKINFGKHSGQTLKEILETDKKYIEYLRDNVAKAEIQKAVALIKPLPSLEEQKEMPKLMEELHRLLDETNTDHLKFYGYYGCTDGEMTPAQMKDAIKILKEKKDGSK